MKLNKFKIVISIFLFIFLTGCNQEHGEMLVKGFWPFLKYGWTFPFCLSLICFYLEKIRDAFILLTSALLGLGMWLIFYILMCPEYCKFI